MYYYMQEVAVGAGLLKQASGNLRRERVKFEQNNWKMSVIELSGCVFKTVSKISKQAQRKAIF